MEFPTSLSTCLKIHRLKQSLAFYDVILEKVERNWGKIGKLKRFLNKIIVISSAKSSSVLRIDAMLDSTPELIGSSILEGSGERFFKWLSSFTICTSRRHPACLQDAPAKYFVDFGFHIKIGERLTKEVARPPMLDNDR